MLPNRATHQVEKGCPMNRPMRRSIPVFLKIVILKTKTLYPPLQALIMKYINKLT